MKLLQLLVYLISASLSIAQQTPVVQLSSGESSLQNGRFILSVTAQIDPQYHIYGVEELDGPIATALTFELPAGLVLDGALVVPQGKKHFDQGFGIDVTWHSGSVIFQQPVKVVSAPSANMIKISFRYQACTESYCLPPKTLSYVHTLSDQILSFKAAGVQAKTNEKSASVEVAKKDTAKQNADTAGVLKEKTINQRTDSYESLRKESLASFIGLAFLTGFLALLTPCVFPMIPITVSFFTKHSATTRIQSLKKSLVYVAGIIFSFTLFGWFMSIVVGAAGAQNFAANVWINMIIGILFVVFATSLFGVFEIRLPSFLVNWTQSKSDSQGYAGTLFAGVTFTLVSFTCTVQFLGLLMVASANGEWFLPIIGMLAFATAFSAPFFVLSLFPQYLANLPKSGSWLHATKIVMAFVEIAAAFKFFSNVDLVWDLTLLTRPVLLSIWIVIFGVAGFYLLGKLQFSEDDRVEKIGFGRTSLAMIFLTATVYFVYGLFGNSLQSDIDAYLPPADYGVVAVVHSQSRTAKEENWIEHYETALERASTSDKPMFIDFTGKTCTNCRLMEKTMFVREDVRELFDQMVLVRLWTDFGADQERYQELQQKLVGSVALPFYAVVDRHGNVLAKFGGLERDPEIFKAFLRDGLNQAKAMADVK
ncbi:thioredoxin family protein [bacterium]|nr:thioredoxin family protein [bacterium]